MTTAPAFCAWRDQFFASYYRHRPVHATFIGVHHYDHLLPDFSPAGVAAAHTDTTALLAALAALPDEPLTVAEAIDRRLAAGFLRIQSWEYSAPHSQAGNPCVYTGEAAFGLLSLLRRPFAPLAERLDLATQRALAIPLLFDQARMNLQYAPHAWVVQASNECDGLLALLRTGLALLLKAAEMPHPQLLAAADAAATATLAFQDWLRTGLAQTDAGYSCGEEALALLLRDGHCLTEAAAAICEYAEHELVLAIARRDEQLHALGLRDWPSALAQLADQHPTQAEYLGRYQAVWEACRRHATQHELLSWPDAPIRYLPRPSWVRAAADQLYFLFYHAPAPFDDLPELEYLVTPIEADMPADQQLQLLRVTNDSVIKLNHVVHHGAIGHHVQNWHAARAASRIGQIAAVDCASRIAMLCGGTMAEGWACYATDLMNEYGFLTPLEQVAEAHTRLRMCARAIADIRIHTGEWTLPQAAMFYQERAAMPAAAAQAEALKNSMFPATGLMYLLGTDQIHRLRRACAARPGFTLRSFHDQFLSYGSIPVALIAAAMQEQQP